MSIKRYIPNISLTVLMIGLVFVMQILSANAQGVGMSTALQYAGFPSPMDLFNSFLAYFINAMLGVTSFLLGIAASILDVSIKITLHIKDFVDATPAIYTVWQTLRDISGLFFIFVLLYSAIQTITGVGKGPSYGDTIKNIIIAGIMINFSFFIVSIGIDTSNIASQAIYNAMIPNHAVISITDKTTLSNLAVRDSSKPEISNIFMNSLKIQSLYNTQGNKIGVAVSDPFKIILIGVVGVIMMLTTAASFLIAAIAFIARIVILLFLLAFSPLWFAGTIVPGISKYVDQFKKEFIAQLIFMPVYLLLMYVALRILNGSNIMGAATASISTLPTGANWAFPYIVLGVNFAIVIMILNLPLIAGLSLGGKATSILSKSISKWDANNIWGSVGKGSAGFVGRNSLGRVGQAANDYVTKKYPVGSNTLLGQWALRNTTGALANSGFGSGTSRVASQTAAKTRAQAQQAGRRLNSLQTAVANNDRAAVKLILSQMSDSSKAQLDKKLLNSSLVLEHLGENTHKAISSGTMSDKDKADITANRLTTLQNAVTAATANPTDAVSQEIIKNMMKNASGDTLADLDTATLQSDVFISHLLPSQLKQMEHVDRTIRKHIGDQINNWTGFNSNQHSAYDYVQKNRTVWG